MTPAAPLPSLDLFLNANAPQDRIVIPCPPEPIQECESCFYFGQYLTYTSAATAAATASMFSPAC